MAGALCTVTTNAGSWDVVTPGTVPVGSANGDLRVSCNDLAYRSSDVIYQASGASSPGFGVGLGGGSGNVGVGFGLNEYRASFGDWQSPLSHHGRDESEIIALFSRCLGHQRVG